MSIDKSQSEQELTRIGMDSKTILVVLDCGPL